MLTCINKNSYEFRTLLQKSGLDDFIVEAYCRRFMTDFNRFPNIDEIPGADSQKYFNNLFELNNRNSTTISNLLDKTGTSSIEEAIIEINKQFSDYETYVLPIGERVIINQIRRPTKYKASQEGKVDLNPSDFLIFSEALQKLSQLYGIGINAITMEEVANIPEIASIPGVSTSKAFVYNGNIYLNVDLATIDSPIHELMHLFVGSMRFTNPEMYLRLLESSAEFSNLESLQRKFPNRTQNDLLEESFVEEFSNYISGKESKIIHLEKDKLHELFYNINRVLDSILLGEATVKSINRNDMCQMNLRTLAKLVNSSQFSSKFEGALSEAQAHRILSNKKQELMQQNKLQEVCK